MNLLRYEFTDAPFDSINGMLRTLVTDLRYNSSMVTVDQFKEALPALQRIEKRLQQLDNELGDPHRNYIEEIMQELSEESDHEINLADELKRASVAMASSLFDQEINFEDFSYLTGKAEHYHWLRFTGYIDQRPVDANLLIVREVFRSMCNKYGYIFIDLS